MWWTKQDDGFTGWFHVKQDNGALRTGLVNGDFTVTVRSPLDDDGYSAIVTESAKSGLYYFQITDTFITTNGPGEYGVVIEVDTFSGPSASPHVRDSISEVFRVTQEDFDSLINSIFTEDISGYTTKGTFGYAAISIENAVRVVESQRGTHSGANGMFYWDPINGDDANNGLTALTAKATWGGATGVNSMITPYAHDIIILIAGEPNGLTVITEQIDVSKEYTFIRGPGRDVLFRPTATTGATVTVSAEGVELSGFRIETAATGDGNALECSADFLMIKNVWVEYARENGIVLQNTSYSTLDKVHIRNTGQNGGGNALTLRGITQDCAFNFIYDTLILGNANHGVYLTGANCFHNYIWGGSEGTTIITNDGYGVLEENNANYNHFLGPTLHLHDNALGNSSLSGSFSVIQNVTQWSTHTQEDIWDVLIGGHTTASTFGKKLGKEALTLAKFLGLK